MQTFWWDFHFFCFVFLSFFFCFCFCLFVCLFVFCFVLFCFSFLDPLSITCPDLNITALGKTGATVLYQVPWASASGGMPPYEIACSPPSGTLFSISPRHTVTCTLTDATSTEKVCTFFVQVNG